MKQEHLLHAIVGESLIPYIESSFLWFANIEVSRDRANAAVRIRRPEWRDEDAHRRPWESWKSVFQMFVIGIFPQR